MALGDRRDKREGPLQSSAGPWGAPPAPVRKRPGWRDYFIRNKLSVLLFVVICLSVGVRMYRDLSTPDAWEIGRAHV